MINILIAQEFTEGIDNIDLAEAKKILTREEVLRLEMFNTIKTESSVSDLLSAEDAIRWVYSNDADTAIVNMLLDKSKVFEMCNTSGCEIRNTDSPKGVLAFKKRKACGFTLIQIEGDKIGLLDLLSCLDTSFHYFTCEYDRVELKQLYMLTEQLKNYIVSDGVAVNSKLIVGTIKR